MCCVGQGAAVGCETGTAGSCAVLVRRRLWGCETGTAGSCAVLVRGRLWGCETGTAGSAAALSYIQYTNITLTKSRTHPASLE